MAVLFGFHAVQARLRHAPASIREVMFDEGRRDKRMTMFLEKAKAGGVKLRPVDAGRLLAAAGGNARHQGLVAVADELALNTNLYDVLDAPNDRLLLLVLDGITDPHNLGACLRVADAAGVDAVIAPRDRSAGLNATVSKVASGAAETVPYITVTNLARTLGEIAESGVQRVGTCGDAEHSIYDVDGRQRLAWVLGAEGDGMRRLTRENCDRLVHIPMAGSVDSLNASVAASVCLFETVRQRRST
ncbi:MAG: 23S rRNA (guanosine(2251)-2'-O)-methyltransferase RlmB [Burkholderiaceae bacterium]